MLNILLLPKQQGHQDPFKSCGYVFKVQTEHPRHFKDQLPLAKVGLVRVSAFDSLNRAHMSLLLAFVFFLFLQVVFGRHLFNPIKKNQPSFPSFFLSLSLTSLHYYFL